MDDSSGTGQNSARQAPSFVPLSMLPLPQTPEGVRLFGMAPVCGGSVARQALS
jgi:hypothetical protein